MYRYKALGWLMFLILFMADGVSAQAFPFRAVKKGDPLPAVTLADSAGASVPLAPFGKGVGVFLFIGADAKIKKRHSVRALREIPEKLKPFKERVKFVVIDAQGDPPGTVKSVAAAAGYDGTILLDPEKVAYKAFGIFVMPSALVVKDGKIVTGFGYTHNFSDLVKGEVEVALGLKTREEVEAALHPKAKEMSAGKKEALRYANLGKTMLKRGMVSQAEAAFQKALKSDETSVPALLGMAEIALTRGDMAQAESYLEKAQALAPGALATVLVSAKVLAAQKKVDEALAKILPLALTHPRSAEIDEVLGRLYEQKGDFKKAAKYYKKALTLCQTGE